MTDPAWAGVDLGTQSVRAVVLDDRGTQLGYASEPFHSRRTGDRHEQDPAEWLAATARALRGVTRGLPSGTRVEAVAVSGTSGTIVPIARSDGAPRGAAVMYDDRRGAAHLRSVADSGAEVWSRLGYRMQESWGLPKMLQMRDEGALDEGDVVFAHQPDVVNSMLAGRRTASDLSSALKSGADLDRLSWPEAVLDALGLAPTRVNDVVGSGEPIGEVTADAADTTGLPAGCRIVAGMTDGCAAQIAAGALTPGSWNSVLGTTLVVKGASLMRHPDPSGAVYAHRAPFCEGWYPGGASSTGAGSISHLLPGRDLDALTRELGRATRPPVAYPLIGRGERFPFVAADATSILPPAGDDVATFSAILHGVAYAERLAYDLLATCGYDTSGPVFLTGGGVRNPWWTQLRADMLGRELRLPAHSEGAAGMAILAAAGHVARNAGAIGPRPLEAAAARMAGPARTIAPRPEHSAPLLDAYGRLIDALESAGWLPPTLAAASRQRAAA